MHGGGEQWCGNPAIMGMRSLREVGEERVTRWDIQGQGGGSQEKQQHCAIFHNRKITHTAISRKVVGKKRKVHPTILKGSLGSNKYSFN